MKTQIVIATLVLALAAGVAFKLLAQPAAVPETDAQKIVRLEAQLKQAMQIIAETRQMPVALKVRRALTGGGGYVLILQNQTGKTLPVKVVLTSPTFGKSTEFDEVLGPAQIIPASKEIGHIEGWTLAPGDEVELKSAGWLPLKTTVTEKENP